MNVSVESVEYAANPHAISSRVPIATLVYENGTCRLVEEPLDEFVATASLQTRAHLRLVLCSLRDKVAAGVEPTSPSAQVFLLRLTGKAANDALERIRAVAGPRAPVSSPGP